MVLNSWEKIVDDLPREHPDLSPHIQINGQSRDSYSLENHGFANDRSSIISEFVDLSTSSEKLFEDISLKKIKKMASDRVEKEVIGFVLDKVGWNRSRAAKILKISYKTLLYKMTEFEVTPPIK
jgi:DNA-binding NtrC family response regulator